MVNYKDLYVNQGASFVECLTLVDNFNLPINLTNYDVQARMSRSTSASDYMTIDIYTNDPANGAIQMSLTSDATSNLTNIKYVYELVAIDDVNNVTKLLEGLVIIDRGIGLSTDKYIISY